LNAILLTLRWTTRILGTTILVLIAPIAIGECLPNPFAQPLAPSLLSVAIATMIVGLAVAWKWIGGGLLILGGLAFFAHVNQGIRLSLVFGLMLAVGLVSVLRLAATESSP